jgi:hypothetical protein
MMFCAAILALRAASAPLSASVPGLTTQPGIREVHLRARRDRGDEDGADCEYAVTAKPAENQIEMEEQRTLED